MDYYISELPKNVSSISKRNSEAVYHEKALLQSMSERVHFIPVGFDFERLLFPISKGQLKADRVVIITQKNDPEDFEEDDQDAAKLAGNMAGRLWEAFGMIDIEVEKKPIEAGDLYSYEALYPEAYRYLLDELQKGNEVFVNISSMPRTVAFAFATAANSLIAEERTNIEEPRENLHTYYVSPENYLVHDLVDELEKTAEFLDRFDVPEAGKRKESIQNQVKKIKQGGVTEGTKELGKNGETYVEFPSVPSSDIQGFEETVLRFLEGKKVPSTTKLAEQLADYLDEEYDGSFRSRVQYNVSKLDEKGYVNREEVGNRLEIELSTMGRMWAETHIRADDTRSCE